jgi:hypothetical protein
MPNGDLGIYTHGNAIELKLQKQLKKIRSPGPLLQRHITNPVSQLDTVSVARPASIGNQNTKNSYLS